MPSSSKNVYFNFETEKDLLVFANSLPSFSAWVKNKIREEMSAKPQQEKGVSTADTPTDLKKLVWKL